MINFTNYKMNIITDSDKDNVMDIVANSIMNVELNKDKYNGFTTSELDNFLIDTIEDEVLTYITCCDCDYNIRDINEMNIRGFVKSVIC